jgi:mono/diheme cytochrome c family protein
MTARNAFYFKNGEFKPDATKSAEWNRGAYLVEGLGHCGACHTSNRAPTDRAKSRPSRKSTLGGDDRARFCGVI